MPLISSLLSFIASSSVIIFQILFKKPVTIPKSFTGPQVTTRIPQGLPRGIPQGLPHAGLPRGTTQNDTENNDYYFD